MYDSYCPNTAASPIVGDKMARFCTECGKEIALDAAFCSECGSKSPIVPNEQIVAEASRPSISTENAPIAEKTPVQTNQPHQDYIYPHLVSPLPASTTADTIVSTGTYFGLMLLFLLPVVGFVLCLIMTFAPRNRNIKHFARAMFIWMVITIILAAVTVGAVFLFTNFSMDYINNLTGGQFGDFGEMIDSLDNIKELTEQFQKGGIENLPDK